MFALRSTICTRRLRHLLETYTVRSLQHDTTHGKSATIDDAISQMHRNVSPIKHPRDSSELLGAISTFTRDFYNVLRPDARRRFVETADEFGVDLFNKDGRLIVAKSPEDATSLHVNLLNLH